ncbi:MAG: winged helix-turn-helix domain-containing protein, partial [Robiginitomaculum sp.]
MFMIKSGFLSRRERRELESVVRCPGEDHGIARRCNALLLLDDGKSCQQIAQYLYLDDDTIRTWYKKYAEGGFDLMASFDYKGGFSKLSVDIEAALVSWLEARVCQNVHEVRAFIWHNWQVDYSKSGCIKLLHRLGFEYKKPTPLPAHINEQA